MFDVAKIVVAGLLSIALGACGSEDEDVIHPARDLTVMTYCPLNLTGGKDLVDLTFWEKDINLPRGYRTTGRSVTLRLPAAILRTRGACGGGAQSLVHIGWPATAAGLDGRFAPKALTPPPSIDAWASRPDPSLATSILLQLQKRIAKPFDEADLTKQFDGQFQSWAALHKPAKRVGNDNLRYCGFEMFATKNLDGQIFDHLQGKYVVARTLFDYPFNTADYFLRRGPSGLFETVLHCTPYPGSRTNARCDAETDIDGFRATIQYNAVHLCQHDRVMSDIDAFLKGSVVARTPAKNRKTK